MVVNAVMVDICILHSNLKVSNQPTPCGYIQFFILPSEIQGVHIFRYGYG